jgi:hypothetical protein
MIAMMGMMGEMVLEISISMNAPRGVRMLLLHPQ